MDRKQQAALGLSLLLAAFYAAPALAATAPATPAPADFRRTSWTELAQQYGNPYFTDEAQAALSPEVLAAWWTVFHDDVLDDLIRTALTNSRDLAAARSRLNQARAQLGIAKAARLPWLNAGGGWVRAQVPDNVVDGVLPAAVTQGPLGPYDTKKEGSYAGLDAAWELDIFGKTRARVRSASNSLQARNAQLYSTWVSLSAEVALNYITLRTLQERLRLALPESVDEIAIELSSGDVRIETLALSVLSLHSTSGDVDLDTVAVEELTHRSTSGDLQGDNIRFSTLRSDTTSGDVKLDGSVLRCAIHTVSGDMDLSGDFPTCELSSVSGDVELEGTPVYWRVKTVSGEVDLSLPNGDTTLYFRSRSGEAGGVWRSGVRMVEDPEEAAIVVETVSGDLSL